MYSKLSQWLLLGTLLCGYSDSAWSAWPQFSDRFDREIRRATKAYWGDYPDWRYWKAQLAAESNLNPSATSPVGAMGIAQIMPATFAELASKMGYTGISAYDPAYGIALGAYYMADLRSKWSSPRPTNDRHLLAVASYNAGFGNLLRSQMVCGNPNLFADIFRCLPQVTGSHAQETIGYVNRIQRYRGIMAYD